MDYIFKVIWRIQKTSLVCWFANANLTKVGYNSFERNFHNLLKILATCLNCLTEGHAWIKLLLRQSWNLNPQDTNSIIICRL